MSIVALSITVGDVRESVALARSHGEKFFEQIVWQVENETWSVLGYESWDAMRAGEYGDMGVVAPRADRPELVARLRAKGLTQAQIAGTLGVHESTVSRELADASSDVPETITNARGQERPASYTRTETTKVEETIEADAHTGEVLDDPGLDGKTYTHTPRVKPAEDVAQVNAETESKALGRALMTLSGMKHPAHRNRIITEWWPSGNDAVPPDSRALFEPTAIRDIAAWLLRLADELEGTS